MAWRCPDSCRLGGVLAVSYCVLGEDILLKINNVILGVGGLAVLINVEGAVLHVTAGVSERLGN
jgi:hypothetical protein